MKFALFLSVSLVIHHEILNLIDQLHFQNYNSTNVTRLLHACDCSFKIHKYHAGIETSLVSLQIDTVIVIGSKCSITLWTFTLPGFVPGFQAIQTEHMETFSKNGILLLDFTGRACQLLFIFPNLLQEHFIS